MELQDLINNFRENNGGQFTPSDKGFRVLDLGGKTFNIDQPIYIHKINNVIFSNFRIHVSEKFSKNSNLKFEVPKFTERFALNLYKVKNILLKDIYIDCGKYSSGISVAKFLRVKIVRQYVLHQTKFGIYSPKCSEINGNNHELEILDSNIMEYEFGDGYGGNKGYLPNFDEAPNRTSTGIFLGQADNVIADCNIHLCKVGILSNMRANRIQGNHITAGGTKERAIFDCIVVKKNKRGACLIHNNYIDNGRLLINTSSDKMADRNYVHITDNIFYRGYNHPVNKKFNHIYVLAEDKNSSFANVIINSNIFYNQDANLDPNSKVKSFDPNSGLQRIIMPLKVDTKNGNIDNNRCWGSSMEKNTFTNSQGLFEIPQSTNFIVRHKFIASENGNEIIELDKYVPFGQIVKVSIIGIYYSKKSNELNSIANLVNNNIPELVVIDKQLCVKYKSKKDFTLHIEVRSGSFYKNHNIINI